MLPDSASKSKKECIPFSQLLSQISDNSSYYIECMEQINHVSSCRDSDNSKCSNPFCIPLQRDLYA